MQPRRFVLQALDPEYGHPAFEAMFVVERPEELRALLGAVADNDPELELCYTPDPVEVTAISRHFDVPFEPEGRATRLYQWTGPGEIPYLVHTGYELVLMLDGRKKFARMSMGYPPGKHEGEDLFDRYVVRGTLHKEVELERLAKPIELADGRLLEAVRTAYYTLKGEEWRIPAWKLILKASRKSTWSDDFERLQGMLFGYDDWQNDWWIEDIRKSRLKWGTLLVYLAVTASDLAAIENAGCRALPLPTNVIKVAIGTWEEPGNEEPQRLMAATDAFALVRFRVKARPFLELTGHKQQSIHELSPDRVKDLNRLIIEDIEIVMRRDGAPP
jgi:hypothetical protein